MKEELDLDNLKPKIESILNSVLPTGFLKSVQEYIDGLGGVNLKIWAASSNENINGVKGQKPEIVSLLLRSNGELKTQIFGGSGGGGFYVKPDLNNVKEKYNALTKIKVPFRTPQPNEKSILKAITLFFERYFDLIKKNKHRLKYSKYVDYDSLLGGTPITESKGMKINLNLLESDSYDEENAKNGYIAFYKGKKIEVYANTSYEAQQYAALKFKAKKSYDVTVVLAEKNNEQVTHRLTESKIRKAIKLVESVTGKKVMLKERYDEDMILDDGYDLADEQNKNDTLDMVEEAIVTFKKTLDKAWRELDSLYENLPTSDTHINNSLDELIKKIEYFREFLV